MKKALLVLFSLCFAIPVSSQTSSVKKVIKKYDALYMRKIHGEKQPQLFWSTVVTNNPRQKDIQEGIKSKNKSLNDAFVTLSYIEANYKDTDIKQFGYDSIKVKLAIDLGIDRLVEQYPLIIISDGEINASMDYKGQMRIFRGAITRLTYNELLAVCAHEIAHYVCSHVTSRLWKSAKKARTNKMWADIGVSVFMGAMIATAGSNAYYGLDNSYIDNITKNADLFYYTAYDYANDATLKYTYRYSRDEESEADIIAYRFMEYMGYGGENVISMLQKLKTIYGDAPRSKYNNHPTLSFRIQVLETIKNGYSKK